MGKIESASAPPTNIQVGESVPVQIRAEDESGNAIEGVRVTFSVMNGGGTVTPAETNTQSGGIAHTVWTLGTEAGEQVLRATASGQSTELSIRAQAGPPSDARIISGDEQVGTVGAPLPSPVQVQVDDAFGNGAPNTTVTFSIVEGGGSVSPASASTDGEGRATASWTLGTETGPNRLQVRVRDLSPFILTATAEAAAPSVLRSMSGSGQSAQVATPLSQPLVVEVTDEFGNAVSGVEVTFLPSGDGAADPAVAASDAQGRASTVWTMGSTVGLQELSASVAGADPVVFEAQAEPGPPATVRIVSGDGQESFAGATLPAPVVVAVIDQFENPVPDIQVDFVVTQGDGSSDPTSASTDQQGQSSSTWTLGPDPGTHVLEARVSGLEPAVLQATAPSGPPADIQRVSGDNQTGEVGTELSQAVSVQVLDQVGNKVPGAFVEFAVTSGGGSVSSSPVPTDEDGTAGTMWTLGTTAGENALEARVAGLDPLEFTALAVPAPAATLAKVSGDNQSGAAGTSLPQPVVVRVEDEFGNGVPGVAVSFSVTEGQGSVSSSTVETDTSGEAAVSWTLGPDLGTNELEAEVEGLGALAFSATATTGPPAEIVKVLGDGQYGEVGITLGTELVVELTDESENPTPGVSVSFSASGDGSASPASAITDASGRAGTSWTLGTNAGTQSLSVQVSGLSPVTFTATAQAGPPVLIEKTSGDGQSAAVGSPLPVDPEVGVSDEFGNPVSGVSVTFSVTGGGGSISGAGQTTDGQGRAAVGRWTLGPAPGTNTLQASASGVGAVQFTATGTPGDGDYDIDIRFVGDIPTSSRQAAFTDAAARWEQVVTDDLTNIPFDIPAGDCGTAPHPAFRETVDDLLIWVEITAIDGAGGTYGRAGPCYVRTSGGLSVMGTVEIDEADVATMEGNGSLGSVILHEMGHVIGIGTLSAWYTTLVGQGGSDPYWPGANAVDRYRGAGGAATNPVPVANTGGSGTRDAHWRESDLGTELMTGYLGAGISPLSAITVGALLDMGYRVDFSAADSYSVGGSLRAEREELIHLIELPTAPPKRVDDDGTTHPPGG